MGMLLSLHIKNLAIVEKLSVDFAPGLNVLTGETGAGKSIIVGALGLIIGERADKSIIRAESDKCTVEAVFYLKDSNAVDALFDEIGIEPCDDGQLVIRRVISVSGSGKITINDSPATLQALKRLGVVLLDFHGPHDHQSLLNRKFQLEILDSFGGLEDQCEKYNKIYKEMLELKERRRELDGDDLQVEQQIDMLTFQIKEIEAAGLEETDDETLENRHASAANAQRIIELANGLIDGLTEGEMSAFSSMTYVQRALKDLSGLITEASDWLDESKSISVQIQELASSISNHIDNIETDPHQLQILEDRMSLIHRLKKKYGQSFSEIAEFLNNAKERLNDLQTRGKRIAELDSRISALNKELMSSAGKLSVKRQEVATALACAITEEIHPLGFKDGAFFVDVTKCDPGPSGIDAVDFGFGPNLGEPMRPLRTIASSGEISRVMLATKAVLAEHDRIPILVFDEIDANVGGETGSAIGVKLVQIAKKHQVFCITHLPQVAIHGSTHFVVTKEVKDDRTITSINVVNAEARAEEIARMLGGKDLTSVTLRHARELLKLS